MDKTCGKEIDGDTMNIPTYNEDKVIERRIENINGEIIK